MHPVHLISKSYPGTAETSYRTFLSRQEFEGVENSKWAIHGKSEKSTFSPITPPTEELLRQKIHERKPLEFLHFSMFFLLLFDFVVVVRSGGRWNFCMVLSITKSPEPRKCDISPIPTVQISQNAFKVMIKMYAIFPPNPYLFYRAIVEKSASDSISYTSPVIIRPTLRTTTSPPPPLHPISRDRKIKTPNLPK